MKIFPIALIVFSISTFLSTGAVAQSANKINWLTFEEALAKNEKEPRKILLDVYTDWCGWCKRMDATTYSNPMVIEMINQEFYAVKLDGEYKGDIEFKGQTFKYVANGKRGYHELPAAIMQGKLSYPTTSFMDEEFNIITNVPGYQDKKAFHKIMAFIANGHYKEMKWQDFDEKYESPF